MDLRYMVLLNLFLFLASVSLGHCYSHNQNDYEVVYGWKHMDFQFPSPETRDLYIKTGQFIPKNCALIGIKLWGSNLFLTVPRYRLGIPSTLNVIDMKNPVFSNDSTGPLLAPFPSWEMQQIGNCSALQFIMSMEVDEFDRMWILDVGRLYFADNTTTPDNSCPPKLIVMDLVTKKILRTHIFPEAVVSRTKSFLNDITIGCENGSTDKCWAYICDEYDPKLVIYNFEEDSSYFVFHSSFVVDPTALILPINGVNYTFIGNAHINGIALSPKSSNYDRFYYNPLTSFSLFSAATSHLKTASNGEILKDEDITTHTNQRASQMAGMMMDSKGILYYAHLQFNAVVWVNTTAPRGFLEENLLVQDGKDLLWADCYGLSNNNDENYLYFTTNRIHLFNTFTIDWNDVNFRVIRVKQVWT